MKQSQKMCIAEPFEARRPVYLVTTYNLQQQKHRKKRKKTSRLNIGSCSLLSAN